MTTFGGIVLKKAGEVIIKKVPQIGDKLNDLYKISQLGGSNTTSGRLSFKDAIVRDFKKAHFDEPEEKIQEKKDGTKVLTGGQLPDPDDEENKDKFDPQKNHDKKALHGKHGNFYKDSKTGEWFSKDTAGHSGQSTGKEPSAWKVFKETKKGLEWKKDVDQFGRIIEGKHKGPVGQEISWNDLIMKK